MRVYLCFITQLCLIYDKYYKTKVKISFKLMSFQACYPSTFLRRMSINSTYIFAINLSWIYSSLRTIHPVPVSCFPHTYRSR